MVAKHLSTFLKKGLFHVKSNMCKQKVTIKVNYSTHSDICVLQEDKNVTNPFSKSDFS